MDVNIKIGFDERAQTLLEGFYASVGRLTEHSCAAGCTKREEKTADQEGEKSDFDAFVDAMVDEVVTAPIEAAAKEAAAKEASVPTAEPAYTFPEIQRACAKLVQEGKREDLAKLIKSFDIQSLPDLKEEQYDAFVLLLREIGGTI